MVIKPSHVLWDLIWIKKKLSMILCRVQNTLLISNAYKKFQTKRNDVIWKETFSFQESLTYSIYQLKKVPFEK